MSIIRGKVRVGKLVQTVIHAGSPTNLHFEGDKVFDDHGREVHPRPMKELETSMSDIGPYRSPGVPTPPRERRRPVPTRDPMGDEVVNRWIDEWHLERRELEAVETALEAANRRADAAEADAAAMRAFVKDMNTVFMYGPTGYTSQISDVYDCWSKHQRSLAINAGRALLAELAAAREVIKIARGEGSPENDACKALDEALAAYDAIVGGK